LSDRPTVRGSVRATCDSERKRDSADNAKFHCPHPIKSTPAGTKSRTSAESIGQSTAFYRKAARVARLAHPPWALGLDPCLLRSEAIWVLGSSPRKTERGVGIWSKNSEAAARRSCASLLVESSLPSVRWLRLLPVVASLRHPRP
jgi:hypothetical protein